MDLALDPALLVPALLFTVAAVYLASSLLRKAGSSSSSARDNKPRVGRGDDVPPSRARGRPAAEDRGVADRILDSSAPVWSSIS